MFGMDAKGKEVPMNGISGVSFREVPGGIVECVDVSV